MSFTTCCPEHPEILRCMDCGYPRGGRAKAPLCEECACRMYGRVFVIEGHEICDDCFRDWLDDYASTNIEDVADALDVEHWDLSE